MAGEVGPGEEALAQQVGGLVVAEVGEGGGGEGSHLGVSRCQLKEGDEQEIQGVVVCVARGVLVGAVAGVPVRVAGVVVGAVVGVVP